MTKYYSRSKQKFVDIEQMPDQYVRNAFVKMCGEESKIYVNWKKLAEDNFVSSVADLDKIERLTQCNDKLQAMNDKLKDTTYQPYDKQGRVRDYQVEYTKLAKQRDSWKEKSMNMVEKSSYDELKKERDGAVDAISNSFEIILEENKQLKFQIEQVDRNQTVSKEAYDIAWQNMELWKKRYESQLPTPILGDVKMFSEIPNDPDGGSFVYLLRKYLNNVSYKIRVRGQYLDEQTKKTEGWKKYERGQPLEKSKCFRVYIDVKKDVD